MFAAFNTHDTDDGEDPNENVYEEAGEGEGGVWGGIAATAPICKHLLACVLAEHCETIFSGMVREEEGSEEEDVRAGLAALGDV